MVQPHLYQVSGDDHGQPGRGALKTSHPGPRPRLLHLRRAMTPLALYGACLPSLLPQPQMAPFTLAMISVLHIQAAGLRSQTVAALALCHRLPFMPEVAPAPIVMMALRTAHTLGFMHPVAELHRRLTPGPGHGDFQETIRRSLGERAAMGSHDSHHPQDQSRHISPTAACGQRHFSPDSRRRRRYRTPRR
jgi:hypothetical protein